MDELVKLVAQKTGLPEETAKVAVETVIGYLKEKLPAPLSGQIDSILQGGGGLNDAVKGLGGFFGKK
jgi:hypothetical protein